MSLAAIVSTLAWGAGGAAQAPAAATSGRARAPVTPNRFDPTSRAATAAPRPAPAPGGRRPTGPRKAPVARVDSPPVTVTLDPSKATQLSSGDAALELDVPAGAVSAADVAAAGGRIDVRVREVAPPSGGTAGGSGHVTFGTFLVETLDASGRPAGRALRQPVGVRLHAGSRATAFDLTRAVAVIGGPSPRVAAAPPARAGAVPRAARTAATGAGRTVTRTPAVDTQNHVLSTSANVGAGGTTVSFSTAAPVAAFGGPDATQTNLGAGALALSEPLSLPAGPGGLTPPLNLVYDSAIVNGQHDPAAAASWVGEGWYLSLGRISWTERNVNLGCCTSPQFNDAWHLIDGFGTNAELIPPNLGVSTYYDDFNGTSITPGPVTWRVTPDTHAKVISFQGPNSLPGMSAVPPCFRVFLPSGIMEEFGCTLDSLQFFPQANGPQAGLDFIANWLPDLITDPQGNQVHITYQQDVETGASGISYPRDAVMATVEYDSPGCHDAQAACTGSAWAPLMRVSFQASPSVAHVAGSSCAANGSTRCDDPVDLSGSGGLAAPSVQSTFVLNDVLVQARGSGGAAWSTLRDYQLAYDQSGPSTITDPFSGVAQSTAGRLDLTRITEVGADGSTALPSHSFSYTQQTSYYEDSFWAPTPTTNCGPSWNNGATFAQGCNLWSQSYAGNSSYLSSALNGQGLQQSFGWQLARNNVNGVPSGADGLSPFACDGANQSVTPCDTTDDTEWSRVVLTSRSESLVRLTQAGQGGTQTSTPVTGTSTYAYRLMPVDDYWGDWLDTDVADFYNEKFMGFGTVTVSLPDGSSEVHQFPASEGNGVYDPSASAVGGLCTSPCQRSPWWDAVNAEHGRELEVDRSNPDGSLQDVVKTQYRVLCPSSGVTGGELAGNLVSELDATNPVALCDVAKSQVDEYFVDGGSQSTAPHVTTTYSYDSYGRMTSQTQTGNDGAGPGSPTTIVGSTGFAWNDAVIATATSATGTYVVDNPAFQDIEDTSGNRYRCLDTSYDGQSFTQGQTSALTLGEPTRSDTFTSCASGGTGPISTSQTYDAFGNPVTADDPDALAGSAAHLGCTVGSGTFSACATYDPTFGTRLTSTTNALGQRTSTGYQAATSGTPTGGFGLWPTSMTDANGQTTVYTYDALGRRTGTALPGEGAGLTTVGTAYTTWCSGTAAQSPCLEVDTIQRVNGSTTVTSRAFSDGLGRLVETRTPAPGGLDVVRYAFYDPSQRLAFESVPYLVAAYTGGPGSAAYSIPDSTQAGTTDTYDGLGRLTSTTDALSHRTTSTYSQVCSAGGTSDSACYRQVATVDPNGHRAVTLVDAFDRTDYVQRFTGSSSSTYAVYATVRYTYDFAGDLTQVLQPDGASRATYQYDLAGRETGMTDPDRGTQTYSYDQDGNLVQSVDARGAAGTVFIGYDGLDRPLWHNTTNSPSGAYRTYTYDSVAGGSSGVGRLSGETFSSGSLSGSEAYAYDGRGRTVSDTLTVGGSSYPAQFGYDDAGNVLTTRYPDGETVTDSYAAGSWPASVSTGSTALLGAATYSGTGGAFGLLTGASLGGGTYQLSATGDLLGRATDQRLTGSGGAVLADQARTFDAAGNVATEGTTLPGGTDNQAFCYDEQNRLTWAGSTGTPPCTGAAIAAGTLTSAQYTQSFTYDAMGWLVTGPLGSYTYGNASHVHAATAVGSGYTASYDAAGDMTCRAPTGSSTCAGSSPSGAQLGYDSEGQLATWQGPAGTVAFLYDGQGRRVAQQQTQGGTTTTTVYVGGLEAVTTSGSTTTTRTYYYAGGNRFAMAVNGTISYLASDGLGGPLAVLSASGSVTASQLFAPYGGVRYANGTVPSDYGFTGQRADAATGLSYYGARYYDPVAGQFTSADTLVPGGGYDPWGLSRYAYVAGNPTTRTDPTGHAFGNPPPVIGPPPLPDLGAGQAIDRATFNQINNLCGCQTPAGFRENLKREFEDFMRQKKEEEQQKREEEQQKKDEEEQQKDEEEQQQEEEEQDSGADSGDSSASADQPAAETSTADSGTPPDVVSSSGETTTTVSDVGSGQSLDSTGPGLDVSGEGLDFPDLSSFDFSSFDLSSFDFSGFDFSGFDLGGFDFSGFDFSGFDLGGFDLGGFLF